MQVYGSTTDAGKLKIVLPSHADYSDQAGGPKSEVRLMRPGSGKKRLGDGTKLGGYEMARVFATLFFSNLPTGTLLNALVIALILTSCPIGATTPGANESPLQPGDTSNPRATLQGFLADSKDAYDALAAGNLKS